MHRKEDESTNENPMVNGHVTNSTKGQVETETQTVLSSPLKRKLYSTNLMNYIYMYLVYVKVIIPLIFHSIM